MPLSTTATPTTGTDDMATTTTTILGNRLTIAIINMAVLYTNTYKLFFSLQPSYLDYVL